MALEAPPASSPAVHRSMMGNKSQNTKPEIRARKILRDAGFPGYRLHWRIDDDEGRYVCRPDITYPGRKLAIFVHGCFWHGHNCKRGRREPKQNADYWREKIARNKARDKSNATALIKLGWRVVTVWECEIKTLDPATLAIGEA